MMGTFEDVARVTGYFVIAMIGIGLGAVLMGAAHYTWHEIIRPKREVRRFVKMMEKAESQK